MTQTIAAPELVSFDDLRTLTGCSKVCITVAIAIPAPAQAEPILKNAVREAGRRLDELQVDARTAAALLEPIRAVANTAETEGIFAKALILFRSGDVFRTYWLRDLSSQFVT